MTTPLHIGIDTGWSATSRSCALAIQGLGPSSPLFHDPTWRRASIRWFSTDSFAATLNLADLCHLGRALGALIQERGAVLVMDAPLAPEGPPRENRAVDGWFRRNAFYMRMQPQDVCSGDGQRLVDAAYEILESMGTRWSVLCGVPYGTESFAVYETNPTVGLALLVPKQEVNNLPSRESPRLAHSGRRIRQKSDWYWELGGNAKVAEAVGEPRAAEERDHERVAALYCLAVSVSLSGAHAVTVGDGNGVYTILDQVHPTWEPDVEPLVHSGVLCSYAQGGFESLPELRLISPTQPPKLRLAAPSDFSAACPIPGCAKTFVGSLSGWDAHVGSLRVHPSWQREVAEPEARKALFRAEFPLFFQSR